MKIRKGFVSNSSSSSFLIGVGRIHDVKKIQEFVTSLDAWDYKIISIDSLRDPEQGSYQYSVSDDNVTVSSFTCTEVSLDISDDAPGALIFILSAGGGCDSDFWNEEWDEMDYDIELSFFSDELVALCNDPVEYGLEDFSFSYGAGRDG